MFGKAPKVAEERIVYQAPGSTNYTLYAAPNFGAAGGPMTMLGAGAYGNSTTALGSVGRTGSVYTLGQNQTSLDYNFYRSSVYDASGNVIQWTPLKYPLTFGSVTLSWDAREAAFYSPVSVSDGVLFAGLVTRSDSTGVQTALYKEVADGIAWGDGSNTASWQISYTTPFVNTQIGYISNVFRAANGDIMVIYRDRSGSTGNGTFRRYVLNTGLDLAVTFDTTPAVGSALKNIVVTANGTLVAFDPATTNTYTSTTNGATWVRGTLTTARTVNAAVRYPADSPLGYIAIIHDAATSSPTRTVQAVTNTGALTSIQTLPAPTFTYGITDIQFCKGWWIVGARTSGVIINYMRTKINIFTNTTLSTDWEQITSVTAGNGLGNAIWTPWR